jgi:hypothetical protein
MPTQGGDDMASYKVRALEIGIYGGIRRYPDGHERAQKGGDTFLIKRLADFSFRWMEAVGWEPDKDEVLADAKLRLQELKASEPARKAACKRAQQFFEKGDKATISRVSGKPVHTIEELEAEGAKEIQHAVKSAVVETQDDDRKRGPKRASDKNVGE